MSSFRIPKVLAPAVLGAFAVVAVILPGALTAAADTPAAAVQDAAQGAVANARDATAIYNDPTAALAGGYALLTDKDDLACIAQPGAGAMGIHYVKNDLVQSGTIDVARPQALVYERTDNGRLNLVALEYVVLQAGWDASHSAPPSLFGQTFMLTPADNRFGLPPFYSLHAWVWKANPSGMFSMWNPRVNCSPKS
jgi:hypothetical protein